MSETLPSVDILPSQSGASLLQPEVNNQLLARLTPADFARLAPHLERRSLTPDAYLARAGEPIGKVCFPEGAVAGFLDVLSDGRRLAVGLVGREGFVGWPLLMGDDRSPYDVVVRAETATALQVDARRLLEATAESPALRDLLLRFVGAFTAQMGRTIVSNLIHPVERRAARWLLLYHDRLRGDEIAITHAELSAMLGVRRASVTDALHILEGERAITGVRGKVIVRDRERLQSLAEETYGHAEAEYRRLIQG